MPIKQDMLKRNIRNYEITSPWDNTTTEKMRTFADIKMTL